MLNRLRQWFGLARAGVPASGASAPPAPAAPAPPPRPAYGSWTPGAAWLAARRATAATYADLDDAAVAAAAAACPAQARTVVDTAERALKHEFTMLGSGWFTPIDLDRQARDGYQPIDWYLDPVRGLRFPRGVHFKAWNLYQMRPGNADIKYPWELARSQHFVTLGQAWRLTGDARFAQEIARQWDDFVEANPLEVGINYTCTMDVGLRVVNWIVALDLVRGAPLDEAFLARAYASLFDHGLFIRANLENTYEVTSNHFLSNVVGLWFLAAALGDRPEAQEWGRFAREALETEINVQVLPDGADFESSVPYHRLVTELFLGCLRLGDVIGAPLSAHYRSRVADMVDYLAAVTRPDGLMPQSGDADDGRLHMMGGAGVAPPQDGRHLFGPAARMFDRPDWFAMGGEAAAWEAAWWGLGASAAAPAAQPPVCRLFPEAGHAVVRDGGTYLLVTNSIVGTNGFGNHKHNDQLAFEYHAGGVAVIVDAGSYVYTSDPAARNQFRGTAFHNTLMIDGVEQNEYNPEWLFRTFEKARAEHLSFAGSGPVVEYTGRHRGYDRLADPVVHERAFRLDRATGRLEIEDRLSGTGRHQLRWHFHCAPGIEARIDGDGAVLGGAAGAALRWPAGLVPVIADSWYSPSYGVRVPCVAIDLTLEAALEGAASFRFTLTPSRT